MEKWRVETGKTRSRKGKVRRKMENEVLKSKEKNI